MTMTTSGSSSSQNTTACPESPPTPDGFTLTPIAIIEMAQGQHFLKVKGGVGPQEKLAWIPVSKFTNILHLKQTIADSFGHIFPPKWSIEGKLKTPTELTSLLKAIPQLPHVVGTSRLGWTPERDAFLYGGDVFYLTPGSQPSYEFVAPEGTLIRHAVQALTPRGSREEQYKAFKELWEQSLDFRLVLALATASPFLEVINAPPIAFHQAGPTGYGKTTLLRLGISAYADPDSPLTRVDFSKDTQNYADAQLGILHNFPLLLDETTLRDSHQLAEAAYNIAVGRTKGRLAGAEQNYLPAEPLTYTLVVFLSGERAIREDLDHRGGTARFIEIVAEKSLLPQTELPKWWTFAGEHHGWFGRDLIQRVIEEHFAKGKQGQKLKAMYTQLHKRTAKWCKDHPRVIDTLAVVQLGYYLASKLLMPTGNHSARLQEAEDFARAVYGRLNKVTKLDQVLYSIREVPGIGTWVGKGFIPLRELEGVAQEFGMMDRGKLGDFLRRQGMVKGVVPRKVADGSGKRKSIRSCILSTEGKKLLQT